MSKIVNEARIKNPIIVAVREQLEHRATWLALLADSAEEKGLKLMDFAPEAIRKCGHMQGVKFADGTTSYKMLKKNLFGKAAQWVFEMDVKEVSDDTLFIDFHYCPLVKAWQKLGYSDERIADLCDAAMCGDSGIADMFDGELELPQCIAKGDPICALRYVKKKK